MSDLGVNFTWILGEFTSSERKQWRFDRFREWFLEDFLPSQAANDKDPEALCRGFFDYAVAEHLVGRGVFHMERLGKKGMSRY